MSAKEVQVFGDRSFPPKFGDVFFGYSIEEQLKSGSCCSVYVCHFVEDLSKKYVIKIGIKAEAKKLVNEINCYKDLSGVEGIPQLIFYKRFVNKSWSEEKEDWIEIDWSLIVIEKLWSRFEKTTSRFAKHRLSLSELVPMAVQQISLLEGIHSRGLVHKGVKPDNFVLSEDGQTVYIIDFNKSKRYLKTNGSHVDLQKDDKLPKGLPLFHSLNYHNGNRSSRRDDMESLGFCWIYLLNGRLPWSDLKHTGHWKDYVLSIGRTVRTTSVEDLCKEIPKKCRKYFENYFNLCRNLGFYDKPDYQQMRQLITSCLRDSNGIQSEN